MLDAREKNSRTSRLVPKGSAGSGKLVAILVALAFAGLLLWSTLASQHVECTVTVEFGGSRGTATASASDEAGAVREAQTAACGPLTHGMNESIACSRLPPVTRRCRKL